VSSNSDSMQLQRRRTATAWDRSVLLRGLAAGGVGACVVAAFFLLFDLLEGRPFQTPAALGARLLLSTPRGPGAEITAILVLAYTVAHTAVFVSIGSIASFLAADLHARRSWPWAAMLGVALFAAMEIIFLSFGLLFDRGLLDELGVGRVAFGNLLAAAAMTPILLGAHTDPETRP
jgi:hypothetical protein